MDKPVWLPFDAPLARYEEQAAKLLAGWQGKNELALEIVREMHPRGKDLTSFDMDQARLTVARAYEFADWKRLQEWVQAVAQPDSAVRRFETAVEAVVDGNIETLRALLDKHPELIHARSSRVTPYNPPGHRATLLHYVAANGVEGFRQRTPRNAIEVARLLLDRGAEVDAFADMYGGGSTTLAMLVSSCHPAQAGLQSALAELLLDYGAAIDGVGVSKWASPLKTALAFGYLDTARTLVQRGARVDSLQVAAGLGLLDASSQMFSQADALDRHRATALAAQMGHVDVLRLLLDSGEDPNRYNPDGNHAHSTPLHQAALAGHEGTVRLLVERGARLDARDTIYHATPLGWAIHGKQPAVEKYLRTAGAL